jgi:hypothetical protein
MTLNAQCTVSAAHAGMRGCSHRSQGVNGGGAGSGSGGDGGLTTHLLSLSQLSAPLRHLQTICWEARLHMCVLEQSASLTHTPGGRPAEGRTGNAMEGGASWCSNRHTGWQGSVVCRSKLGHAPVPVYMPSTGDPPAMPCTEHASTAAAGRLLPPMLTVQDVSAIAGPLHSPKRLQMAPARLPRLPR